MQRSYRDVLCGITSLPVPKTKRNKNKLKRKRKPCNIDCKLYNNNDGCWSRGPCPYNHKSLFSFDNSITIFECSVFGINSNTKILDKYLVTTKNGIIFDVLYNNNVLVSKCGAFQSNFQLWEIYNMFSDARWDDDYHWSFDADFQGIGKGVVCIMEYLREIATTIKKIFLVKNIKELHPDIIPRTIQSLFQDMEHPQYSVYPFYID